MQICSIACTLKSWQVKTICPVSPSEADGKGTDACPDAEVECGEERSKTGVVIDSVTAGDENEEGVEACSVASRSGAGEEAGEKSPHPKRKINPATIQKSFVLFIIQFNRLEIEFFTR